ncbi:Transport protein particle subunit trs31 [Neolecta irregularis DAH-3]|uniref:Trafficking protein particle complex subunit n=1 Tax=Neolecta irregularis (strain DAH-3) TaxID=1198029 RepID=A0A1U7LTN4_NEOID|nr:Transport protein particle subunit trs31 [Neolecta irregularis DAH-3]|eukprot:OLL26004.1 Transport protein particle subunit trs31 [Neolecta irregularis DAH-3]
MGVGGAIILVMTSTPLVTPQSARFSIPQSSIASSVRASLLKRSSIYDKNLNRTKGAETSLSAFFFLFSELIQNVQRQVQAIPDLERKLNEHGYRVGQRSLELIIWRDRNSKRETRILSLLQFIHTFIWKSLFAKTADDLERSTENDDECMTVYYVFELISADMIYDNDPLVNRFISVPKEMSSLNCGAFVAGIIEAVLDGSQFPSRVTAHSSPTEAFPQRTVFLIKLDKSVLEREQFLK